MSPEVGSHETKNKIVLLASSSGITKVDIDIDVTAESISIGGTRKYAEGKPGEKINPTTALWDI